MDGAALPDSRTRTMTRTLNALNKVRRGDRIVTHRKHDLTSNFKNQILTSPAVLGNW